MHNTEIDYLYNEANKMGITIINDNFSDTKKAACLHDEDYFKAIVVDQSRIESQREEKVILFEELSHYETGNLYFIEATENMAIGNKNRIICEARTKHHAIKKHLPFETLRDAIHYGYETKYELAEYFDVTEDFISDAIKYYTENCGLDFNK